MNNKTVLTKHHNQLKELSHELDHNYGSLNLNRLTLEKMNIELAYIAEGVENTDHADLTSMGLTFRDISHKVQLLADLLHYTIEDLNGNLQQTEMIKSDIFDIIIKQNGGTNDDKQ